MSTLPPGPRGQFGAILGYLRDPLHCMVPMVARYGDPFTLPGKPPIVCTGEPEGIRAIYTADPDTLAPAAADMAVFLGDTSLILVGGAEHRRLRRLAAPPFHAARMRAHGARIIAITEAHTSAWQEGEVASIHALAQKISLDVILRVIFGLEQPAAMAAFAELLQRTLDGISPLLALFPALRRDFAGLGPFAAFRRRQRALHAALDEQIAAARATEPRADLLSLLVHARDDAGEALTDQELRDQLLLLVIAGHETTAIAIAWAFDALLRPENAAALERLRAELDALGPAPEPAAIDRAPYLEAACNETLRRYPLAPAPAPRRLLQPMELLGYKLPAGVGVAAGIGVAHFREATYPEPLVFRPERFLERTFSPFEFLPFGGGARRCLGAALAGYEMRLVVATLIRGFVLRLRSLRPDLGKVRAANAGPRHGVEVEVVERT
ncbi:MAG: cytochrome P450 [Myxococcales bacterium]|nr:cytochrome P450 [Myxococcales bacterium]